MDADAVAGAQVDQGAGLADRVRGHGRVGVEVGHLLDHQQRGHDLGARGHRQVLVGGLGVQDGAGVGVHDDRGAGLDRGAAGVGCGCAVRRRARAVDQGHADDSG